jgi:hypothetical protein
MVDSFTSLRSIILYLAKNLKHRLAYEILDVHYSTAQTRNELDLIAELSLKVLHIDLAVQAAEDAYALSRTNEELYASRENLAKAYYAANYPELALRYRLLNLEITPNDFESIASHAAAYKLNNQRDQCEEIIEKLASSGITEDQKKSLEITYAHKYLRTGETAKGIRTFINYENPEFTIFHIHGIPRWNTIPQPGRTIYVNAQGGAGDEIVNIRFFKYLKDLGMNPIFYTDQVRWDLTKVFERNGFEVICVPYLIDPNSTWTQTMILPADLNLDESRLWYGPYLKSKNDPKNTLESKKIKVGIKCSGNPYFGQDRYRTIPIDQLISMLRSFNDIELYHFDIDKTHNDVINLKDKISSWDDTFDYLNQMDLVISSCTSIAHASGAIGIPTIVVVPISEYYIWTSTRKDNSTPWYGDNFYVCKQKVVRSWAEPIEEAKTIIQKILGKK